MLVNHQMDCFTILKREGKCSMSDIGIVVIKNPQGYAVGQMEHPHATACLNIIEERLGTERYRELLGELSGVADSTDYVKVKRLYERQAEKFNDIVRFGVSATGAKGYVFSQLMLDRPRRMVAEIEREVEEPNRCMRWIGDHQIEIVGAAVWFLGIALFAAWEGD